METISAGARRPDLTILLPVWNAEGFVAEAVHSVLAQRDVVAEIILSDDASSDRSFETLRAACAGYYGPHRVLLRRNRRNLGIDHLAALVDLASCDFMVAAHADDIAEPHRAAVLLEEMKGHGAFAVSSNLRNVDESGRPLGVQNPAGASCLVTAEEIATRGWMHTMFGSTLGWHRDVYARFPRLDSSALPIGHDHLVPFRGALLGGFRYVAEPLVQYRRHEGQWKNRLHAERTAEVRRESSMANSMSARLCMLRDVEHLLGRPDGADVDRLRSLEATLKATVLALLREWVEVRDDLYRDGWRADWLPRGDFEHGIARALADGGRRARLRRRLVRLAFRAWGIAGDLLAGRLSKRSTY